MRRHSVAGSPRHPWLVIALAVLSAAVLIPVDAEADQEAASLITVFESGGISNRTAAEVAALGGPTYQRHSGTLRMMSVARDGEPIQSFDPGMGVPMSVTAFDQRSADALLNESIVEALLSDGVVMSARTAALRGALVGDDIVLEGWNGVELELTIVAIVDDLDLGWSEIVMSRDVATGLGFDRVSLLATPGDVEAAQSLRESLDDLPVRVVGPDEDIDRTDFVLPTVLVKQRFGEFSFRPTVGDSIAVDPAWEEANIVTVDLPPLGLFECHRLVVPYVKSVLDDLRNRQLLNEVDPGDFQLAGGCYNSRLIRGGDKGFALSRHSWGIAIDINPSTNRYDGDVTLSQEFGQTFRDWGFSWGAGWLRPDGMHFEWARLEVPETRNCSSTTLEPSIVPGVTWSLVERTRPCR